MASLAVAPPRYICCNCFSTSSVSCGLSLAPLPSMTRVNSPLRLGEVLDGLAHRSPEDLLVELGKLAADGDPPVAEDKQYILQRRRAAGAALPGR